MEQKKIELQKNNYEFYVDNDNEDYIFSNL